MFPLACLTVGAVERDGTLAGVASRAVDTCSSVLTRRTRALVYV